MNNYIINPMFFYWIEVVSTLKELSLGAICAAGGTLIFAVIKYFADKDSAENWPSISEREIRALPGDKKLVKWSLIALIIACLVYIFIPSRDTILYMQIAKMATVENVELTVDAVKSAVEYIITAVKEMHVE